MSRNRRVLIGLVFLGISISAAAEQTLRIDSATGVDTRILIAVPPFASADPGLAPVALEMAQVVAFDLKFSGLFILLPSTQYPPEFTGLDPNVFKLDRDLWAQKTKAEHLVFGVVRQEGEELVCEFRLFDLFSKEQVVGQELRVKRTFPRLAAHRFSEEIIRYLDGIPGTGTSEVCFSGGTSGDPGKGGLKEIYVADYDGANVQQVTKHGSISIKPKMSPDGNLIAYLSYKDRYPFLYVYDRRTGVSTPVSKEVGLNAAPAWSPDGKRLAMVLSKDGNTELYLRDIDGKNPVRLTKNRFGDTSPSFSPDGQQIAFVSDRGGVPQIYVMSVAGGEANRLSFQGGSSYDPAWSPDGKYIAYVVQTRSEGFEIYVMNADGSNPRQLTSSEGSNESPSWSPDSRNITFMSTRNGRAEIWAVTLSTGEEYPLSRIGMSCEGPTWGPRRR